MLVNLIKRDRGDGRRGRRRSCSIQIRSRRDGPDTIRVEVRDAGAGFQDPERALDPFFTTKPQEMGMGLAILPFDCRIAWRPSRTTNNETRGATVTFVLPLSTDGAHELDRQSR